MNTLSMAQNELNEVKECAHRQIIYILKNSVSYKYVTIILEFSSKCADVRRLSVYISNQ